MEMRLTARVMQEFYKSYREAAPEVDDDEASIFTRSFVAGIYLGLKTANTFPEWAIRAVAEMGVDLESGPPGGPTGAQSALELVEAFPLEVRDGD